MNKKIKVSIVMLTGFLAMTSCQKSDDSTPVKKEEPAPTPTPTPDATELKNTWVVTTSDLMMFDTKKMRAVAGKPITLTLKHTGKMAKEVMGHNLVILKEGTDEAAFIAKAAAATATDYIPASEKDSIIANTKLLGGGQEDTITFTIDKKGTYKFLCTFPGHPATMNGVLIIE